MSPRPRRPKNRALPPNLYSSNGGKSYQYRHPVTGKFHGMGVSRAAAIAAAKELNAMLMPDNDLVGKVLGRVTVRQHAKWWLENIAPEREYKKSTLEMYQVQMRKLIAAMGDTAVEDVDVQDLAKLLEDHSARTANQIRQVAVDLFRVAVSRGLRPDNPAEATLKRREKKARQRLTQAQYDAIHARCPRWAQNAMDLALITLQRRGDVSRMRFDDVRDGRLFVVQEKTEKYDTGYLAIAVGPKLDKVIKRCRDDLASPYLVHRRPERKIKDRAGMDHWTQVKPQMITRAFAEARDESELFDGVPENERPTFHEIRALGIKNLKDKGVDPQKLAGHATAKMTSNYDSGHEEIRWVEVAAE
ncbi:phage integrase Arm DNA-binding domain-containing protein [Marinobacter aromaticivorans]|uniref:Phage integrase Arm DNA-binding domain-containing protein n=1 Tax=Marinobacter aromaticivorans TaxID=1494078 RepID=A0ABW2IXT0_9GAMM|nr:phage integrase Arm DNA-binding domain-containing protein [Marinobacter aromaticivorans]